MTWVSKLIVCNAMVVVMLNIGEQSNRQPTFVVLHLHRLYYSPYLLSHLWHIYNNLEKKIIALKQYSRRWWCLISCKWWQRCREWFNHPLAPSPFCPIVITTISKGLMYHIHSCHVQTQAFCITCCPSCLIWLHTVWPSCSSSDIWKRSKSSPSHWT